MSSEIYTSDGFSQWFGDIPGAPPFDPVVKKPAGSGPPFAKHGASLGKITSSDPYIASYVNTVGRPLDVRHILVQGNVYGGDYSLTPWSGEAGVRKILVDFELADDGSQASTFDQLLGSCAAAGQEMDITLWHSPTNKFAAPSNYWAALELYVPIIVKHGFRHIYDMDGWQALKLNNLPVWWPGNSVQVDAIGLEYYAFGYGYGERLDIAAQFADSVKSPFGLCEYGAESGAAGGCDPSSTESEGKTFLSYIHDFFSARYADASIPAHYDLISWNNASSGCGATPGYVITNQPSSWVACYQRNYDLVTKGQ